jgi:DNA-binding transcriptional MocR family regulator
MLEWTAPIAGMAGPRYLAVAGAVELALDSGRLRPGDRLPPQRDLARHLALNIGTVGRAYALLTERGLLSSEVGRGTYVQRPERADGPRSLAEGVGATAFVDLSHNYPQDAPVHPAIDGIVRGLGGELDMGRLLARQVDAGLTEHRECGCRWLERFGIGSTPDDVMVTCGGQHGLTLALAALSRPGDLVLTEELAFYGLRSAAAMLGRTLVGVRMDRDGIMPDYLDAACRRTGAKVVFLTPTLHNPTTATMGPERRTEILDVCARHDLMIVEDEVWNFMLEEPGTSFTQLDPQRTVHVSSFAKIVGPGLRLGLIRMPRAARHGFGVALRATTLMASSISAEWMARLVTNGAMEAAAEALRREMQVRQAMLAGILPVANLITRPEAFFCWLRLTNGWSADSFVAAAAASGVAVTPFSVFEVGSVHHSGAVRLSLNGAPDLASLAEGLGRLASLLASGPQ